MTFLAQNDIPVVGPLRMNKCSPKNGQDVGQNYYIPHKCLLLMVFCARGVGGRKQIEKQVEGFPPPLEWRPVVW